MKKVLSVFLAILMVFSVMAISASAEGETTPTTNSPYFGGAHNANPATQCVFKFRLNTGKCKASQLVYDETLGDSVLTDPDDVPDVFIRVPQNAAEFTVGSSVTLPGVTAPKGYSFVGWKRVPHMTNDPDVGPYTSVPGAYTVKAIDKGAVVEFSAIYEEAQVEQDTFAKVFSILTQIFGTLIGLIAYQGNVEKGQDFMKKILGSISG